jgi:hypothetical protein
VRSSVHPSFLLLRVFTFGGERRGEHSPISDKVYPWGPVSSIVANFTPEGKLMLLKTGLRPDQRRTIGETRAMGREI